MVLDGEKPKPSNDAIHSLRDGPGVEPLAPWNCRIAPSLHRDLMVALSIANAVAVRQLPLLLDARREHTIALRCIGPLARLGVHSRCCTTKGKFMITGKKSASDSSRVLRDPKSTKKEKEAAASELSQAKRHAPPQPAKRPR